MGLLEGAGVGRLLTFELTAGFVGGDGDSGVGPTQLILADSTVHVGRFRLLLGDWSFL